MDLVTALESAGHKLIKKTADEMATTCPGCGGDDRFCVFVETNRYWCRQCDVKGDLIDYFRRFRGMTFPQAASAAGQSHKIKQNGPPGPPGPEKLTKNPPKHTKTPKQTAPKATDKPKIVATYDYHGTDYTVIYQAVRLEPKSFRLRRPGVAKEWVWDMKGIPRVLYKLPDVIESEVVCFVEGEKDADNLWSLGIPATTTPAGVASIDKLQDDHKILDPLAGKTVWILPDNDAPGLEYAKKVAAYIYKVADKVKIVELPVDPGGDVSDFLDGLGTAGPIKLGEYIDKAPWFEPETQGIDVTRLLDTEYEKQPAIISKGVLHESEGLLIAGEGGVGKSMLRLELALHLAMGWDWLDFEIPRARRVLIMQYENSERTEQIRLKMMMEGLGITRIPDGSITWIKRNKANRPDLSKKSGQERLFELVSEFEPHVVVFDCLSNLHSSNENDNIKMRNVMDCFTDLAATYGNASIVIHHFGKPGQDGGSPARYRVRGASGITDWADCVMVYTRKAHEHKALRYLENTKMRNAKELKPRLLERNGNFLSTVVDEDTLCPPSRVVTILETLGGEVLAQKVLVEAIMHETECGDRSARAFIKETERQKMIVSTRKGRQKGFRLAN